MLEVVWFSPHWCWGEVGGTTMISVLSPCPCRRRLMQSTRLSFHCVAESLVSAHMAGAHHERGLCTNVRPRKPVNRWGGAVLTGGAQTTLTFWIGGQAAFWLLCLPSSPSQEKALRCKDGDGTTAFYQIWMHAQKKCKASAT